MPTSAILYLVTLVVAAVVIVAVFGPVGALAAIPLTLLAVAEIIRRLAHDDDGES